MLILLHFLKKSSLVILILIDNFSAMNIILWLYKKTEKIIPNNGLPAKYVPSGPKVMATILGSVKDYSSWTIMGVHWESLLNWLKIKFQEITRHKSPSLSRQGISPLLYGYGYEITRVNFLVHLTFPATLQI